MAMAVKLLKEGAKIPTRSYPTDAGWDFHLLDSISIPPMGAKNVGTGLAILMPTGWAASIKPRSSCARDGLHINDVIEPYIGEISLCLRNFSSNPLVYEKGARVAQLVPFWNGAGFLDAVSKTLQEYTVSLGGSFDISITTALLLKEALGGCDSMVLVKSFTKVPERAGKGLGSSGV